MRCHMEGVHDGPICKKCGKPMRLETWFKGIGVKQSWLCTGCQSRVSART